MELNSQRHLVRATLLLIGFFSKVFILPVSADQYDIICPDSDNPLNISFKAGGEILADDVTVVDLGPMTGIDFIDPRDVACKTNYDDITVDTFKRAVDCDQNACQVDSKCTSQRKETLLRLRNSMLRVLNEIVIKSNGIIFFNRYIGAKRILFGDKPLEELTGVGILKRTTTGRHNIVDGFAISNGHATPDHKVFSQLFSKPVGLYTKLSSAEEPSGLLAEGNVCKSDHQACYDHFFSGFKDRSRFDGPDSKLLALLDETMEFVLQFLTNNTKHASPLKIPFAGHCIASKGLEPNMAYTKLFHTAEMLKHLL